MQSAEIKSAGSVKYSSSPILPIWNPSIIINMYAEPTMSEKIPKQKIFEMFSL